MEVVQISKPITVEAAKKDVMKPVIMAKQEIKAEVPASVYHYSSVQPPKLSIVQRKEPSITSTYIKSETPKNPVPPKEPIRASKYVARASKIETRLPVAMRRKTSKEYKENTYFQQPSLPKVFL